MTGAVVFDMDGVLTDSEPVINAAAIAGLREFGVEAVHEDFLPFVGAGEDRYIGGVAERHGVAYIPAMKKRVYEIYLEILPGMIRPFAGVPELLALLRGRAVPMAVASSADRIKVEANLKALGIDIDWFAAVVVGEDVVHKKPAPDSYVEASRRLGIEAARCCVIEDAPNGIRAAKSAGMRCVAVAQSFADDVLAGAGPDVIRAGIATITPVDLGLPA